MIGISKTALAATAAGLILLGAGLVQAQPQAQAPAQPSPAPAPDAASADPAAALVKERCSMCHDTDLISAGGGRTPQAWADLVASMSRKGAQLSDDEKAQVIAYLAKTYPAAPAN
jgi:cytochrome c5